MRQLLCGALFLGLAGGPAIAQSALEGPLAAPDSVAPKSKPPSHHHKPAKVAHAAKASTNAVQQPSYRAESGAPTVDPTISKATIPNDPLSFGMKWNGNNDDARETRIQNYNGDAQGTGAEVGMKLHF